MLVGIYETRPQHWSMDGAPWDYGVELLQENIDRISEELELVHTRYPVLQTAGIRKWVNGAFTFSPDGNPLVGPIAGKPGYWLACGVMAGFLQGGGVGKALAEWMIRGETTEDVYGLDIARYGAYTSNREYIRQTTGEFYARRFVMTYPNEQLPAGRPLKTTPAYDAMSAAGCQWGNSWGLEIPLYFGPPGFKEKPTLKRSNAFDIVGGGVPRRARRRGAPRYRAFLPLRGDRTGGRKLARLADGRAPAEAGTREARPDAVRDRQAQGRPHRHQLGRRNLLDRRLLLPAPVAYALVRRPCARGRVRPRHFRRRDRLLAVRAEVARAPRARDPSGRLQRRPAVHGRDRARRRPHPGEGRAPVGHGRARIRDQLPGARARRPAPDPARGGCGPRRQGIRLQRASGAEAREELRHLVGRVHPGLYAAHDRHGPLDRLGQGRFRRPRRRRSPSATARSRRSARHARGRRPRRRRVRLRARLAQREQGRVRHLRRLRAHHRQEPGDGADRAGGGGASGTSLRSISSGSSARPA